LLKLVVVPCSVVEPLDGEGSIPVDHHDGKSKQSTIESPRCASRMSRASISKINTLFQDDFELFGYDILPG
jgi:hypothetical protein